MRAAPAVEVRIRRRGAWLYIAVLLSSAAGAALAAWMAERLGLQMAVAAVTASALAGVLSWRWTPVDTGALRWDGQAWSFADRPGELHPAIDLGGWMLLRFHPAERAPVAWLATSERATGAAWHALRAAVYCRRSDR